MLQSLEPISKSFEEDNEAGQLEKAEEILAPMRRDHLDAVLPQFRIQRIAVICAIADQVSRSCAEKGRRERGSVSQLARHRREPGDCSGGGRDRDIIASPHLISPAAAAAFGTVLFGRVGSAMDAPLPGVLWQVQARRKLEPAGSGAPKYFWDAAIPSTAFGQPS
jgi:hypothetical protein